METGIAILILLLGLGVLAVYGLWMVGKLVGKSVSKGTGLILGIILILIGFTLPTGIAVIMYSSKNTSDGSPLNLPAANFNLNLNKSNEASNRQTIQRNYKDILLENGLKEYVDLFEINKLTDISVISMLSEADWEKLGITTMGDRKLIMKIFS